MIESRKRLLIWTTRLACVALALVMASCQGNKGSKNRSIPNRLPTIQLPYATATPKHRLSSYDYPFDSNGNYVTSWAADGERRSGRSAASNADVAAWSRSHVKTAPLSKPKKLTSTPSRSRVSSGSGRKPSNSRSTVNNRSKQNAKKPLTAKSSSYTVRRGDTLSAIARRNKTTVAKLKAANGLRSDNIGIGKNLRIPR